jgi:deazaflavin-dependent oxidoreductase (nitroreductase family)
VTTASDPSSMDDFNTEVIAEFRANGGQVGGPFGRVDMMLLTTKGRKTGASRTSPLACRFVGDDVVVIGSNGGDPRHPQWVLNLIADPEVTVEVGTDSYRARARIAHGEERARIWTGLVADIPQFGDYEQRTDREIPVVVLERA